MAQIRVLDATVQSYDGHDINDGIIYESYIDANILSAPEGEPIAADVDFDWPYFVGSTKTPRVFRLRIFILNETNIEARQAELKQWFNTQRGDEQYLIATFRTAPASRRLACRPIRVDFEGMQCVVTLDAFMPLWESNTLETETWAIVASDDTQAVTNQGNENCNPTLRITGTAVPENTWRFQQPVSVWNSVQSALAQYPLELTGGGWDTAALVTVAAKATAIDDAGDITDADTTITADDTSDFYASGLIIIDDEQIFYDSKDATNFIDCIRGVGGTVAAAHLDDAVINQSECYADGRDIRVELDGVEIPRWFGAAAGVSTGPNHNDTLLWATISEIPAQNDWDSAGELVSLGTDLALDKSVTADSAAAGSPGSNVTDGFDETYWHAEMGATAGTLIIDLGELTKINRVRLFQPNSTDAPKDYTIETSEDGIGAYDVQATVDNSETYMYTNHTFAPVTCRYVKVDVTTVQATGDGLRIGSVNVYYVNHRLRIKYGNNLSGEYDGDDTRKPIFELDSSLNGYWDYDDFFDAANPDRAGAWQVVDYQSAGLQRAYPTTQDGVYADLCTVLGIANKTTATAQFRDGYRLNQPCGISEVLHSGYTKQNPDYRRWRLLSTPELGDVVAEYECTVSSLNVWTAYGPETTTLSQTAIALIFYHWLMVPSDTAMYAEATDVKVTMVNEPTVTLQAVTYLPNSQLIACRIRNQTTEQAIFITGMVETDQDLVIDCEAWTVERDDTGVNEVAMLSMEPNTVRDRWLELQPGENTLEYVETGVAGVTIVIQWRSRWL